MDNSIAEHVEKIEWCDNQLSRIDLSWKRRNDLQKYRNRLKKELRVCKKYLRGE